ncbi:serine protease [Actibacterium sp. 188UL27-1]|uniref:trypsin-like serine peptidase n=1 Tax=Actibacterium sp. 188UL27-1 TaxID=2786961 RepID=UPI00195C1D19|nr:trypsin-like serine protease [Actibacterium sp. 188UL27-1]MBM7066277.1 trypsin-like serine protease [Actibacterium sp. 188UL27-1]
MRGLSLFASALTVCASLLAPAIAEEKSSALRSLTTGDETKGWEGVGRLNLGHTGFCTGALIAENLVLTAAHCLYDKATGKRIATEEIEFLAGWRNGRAEAYRGVRRAVLHPSYSFGASADMSRVANDLALLELDQPIRTHRVSPFETADNLKRGDVVGVVSYAKDRSEAPSIQETCHVLRQQSGVVMLSCSVDFGASGAPIFILGAVPSIASVVSAKAEMDGQQVALAANLRNRLAVLHDEMAKAAPPAQISDRTGTALTARRTTNNRQTTAKFVRP